MIKSRKKNKERQSSSRNKRILTVYSSQALLQPLPSSKASSMPLKKHHKPTSHQHNSSTTRHHKSKDKPHRKAHPRPKPTQSYQRIPMNQVYSNSNSRIEFSSATSGVERPSRPRHQLRINCSQETLMQEIWQGSKVEAIQRGGGSVEQEEAATKIQKVFRGYMTRKVFLRHIDQLQEKLIRQKEELQRKMSYKTYQFQESHSNHKQDYFPSHRKSPYRDMGGEFDQAHQDRQIQRSSLTLNESSIAHQQQENSMSFGQEPQPSPHFFIPPPKHSLQESPDMVKARHYISEDGTRDGLSQNITNSASYSKQADREAYSHYSSRIQDSEYMTERDEAPIERLRSAEKAKWEQVIELVNRQLGQGVDHTSNREIMSVLLQFSLRNREELVKKGQAAVTPTTTTHRQEPQVQICEREQAQITQHGKVGQKINCFKKKSWKEATLELQRMNEEDVPLQSSQSFQQRTQTMREHFLKTLSIGDAQLDRLIQLRESVLRSKESASLQELNRLLQMNHLSQDQFLRRLTQLTTQFAQQKSLIEQTREEIYQGYRAQLQLYKCTILDAKAMGVEVPFCRSMEVFPRHAKWRFDQVMIDELEQLAHRRVSQWQRSRQNSLGGSEGLSDKVGFECLGVLEPEKEEIFEDDDSELSNPFNYEDGETQIYDRHSPSEFDLSVLRQAQPHVTKSSFSIDRYAPISISEFNQAQLQEEESGSHILKKDEQGGEKDSSQQSENRPLRIELFQFESEQQQECLLSRKNTELTSSITDWLVNRLEWELIQQILGNGSLRRNFVRQPRLNISAIEGWQLVSFLQHAGQRLPDFRELKVRLNQKMYPNVRQLLMSMREDDEDSSVEYYEIGQYQYIINQQICYSVIDSFLAKSASRPPIKANNLKSRLSIEERQQQLEWLGRKGKEEVARLEERQSLKLREGEELRAEIMKIELHMVLDSWNQQLIKYRENTTGFSGIGLNELSISLIQRVTRPMLTAQEMCRMFEVTKGQLKDTIEDGPGPDRLLKDYHDFVSNDSQWIFYVQEAMELAFDLLKAMEMELVLEVIEEIYDINRARQNQPVPTQANTVEKGEKVGVKATYPTEEVDSLDDSFESRDSVSAQQELRLRRKIEEMRFYDEDDSFYD